MAFETVVLAKGKKEVLIRVGLPVKTIEDKFGSRLKFVEWFRQAADISLEELKDLYLEIKDKSDLQIELEKLIRFFDTYEYVAIAIDEWESGY